MGANDAAVVLTLSVTVPGVAPLTATDVGVAPHVDSLGAPAQVI